MKEPKTMRELHKIREGMSRMSKKEFDAALRKAREEYKRLTR